MNTIIAIIGGSGSGKTTLAYELSDKLDNARVTISYTNRQKRLEEINGVDYYFTDNNKMDELLNNNEFATYTEIQNNRYGTHYNEYNHHDKSYYISVMDLNGLNQLKLIESEDVSVVSILIKCNNDLLTERIINRGSVDNCKSRIEYNKFISNLQDDNFDFVVNCSDDFEQEINRIATCI